MSQSNQSNLLHGKMLSPGMGRGSIFAYEDIWGHFDEFYSITKNQVDKELERLERALVRIADDLSELACSIEKEINTEFSGIFHAHLAMVQDQCLTREIEKELREELVSAGSAVRTVFRRWIHRFQSMDAEIARQKGDDMRDLERRIVSALAGMHGHALEHLPQGSVLVTKHLLPSDTVYLARNTAAAAILESGGKGSHAALFAREMGLPCVAGISGILNMVSKRSYALVDATKGRVLLDPDETQLSVFCETKKRRIATVERARTRSHKPAITRDGVKISVLANIGNFLDTQLAVRNGADGVGLYRLEKVYFGRQRPPCVHSLLSEMRKTLEPAKGLPIQVRLLDVGADKPLPFLDMPRENNPSLGIRGVRFLLEHPNLLKTQLDALLALSDDFDIRVLVPMVTLPRDMLAVQEAMEEARIRAKRVNMIPLGTMIETPAAAFLAPEIMKYADFISFGTNDLTQYSFAADRENDAVDQYFDDTNEVIFELIRTVHDKIPGVPLSICGELAARPGVVGKLLSTGITSISVVPPSVPAVKEAVRSLNIKSFWRGTFG